MVPLNNKEALVSDFALLALAFDRYPHPFPLAHILMEESLVSILSSDKYVAVRPSAVVDGQGVAIRTEKPAVDLVLLLERHEDPVPVVIGVTASRELGNFLEQQVSFTVHTSRTALRFISMPGVREFALSSVRPTSG